METLDKSPKATVAELIKFIWPYADEKELVPWWPPDVYAVTATILRRTGGYVRVLQLPRDGTSLLFDEKWPERAHKLAREWRHSLEAFLEKHRENPDIYEDFGVGVRSPYAATVAPQQVREWWQKLLKSGNLPVADIESQGIQPTEMLIRLCCVADAASSGIGIVDKGEDEFLEFSMWVLDQLDRRTVCISVPRDRIAVLPKQHTPQRGLTLRSLSHHLSLHPATEVTPRWRRPLRGEQLELINLLLLPWPVETHASDFRVLEPRDRSIPWVPSISRFFAYDPKNSVCKYDFKQHLARAFEEASKHAQSIHAIVFPELALSVDEFQEAERFAFKKRALLMAGVRIGDKECGYSRGRNAWMFQTAGLLSSANDITDAELFNYRVSQSKHHRWCLDRSQILQYNLGGRLPASKDCWELTDVDDRSVEFFTINSWLTWAVLICEDLARQDPVADVIRAVGPNMVVALLMDGPQLKERWPSRYASVLAEDPGCSVLTLTNLGMCRRTQSTHRGNDRSNVIALWRDAEFGPREIELEPGHDACVLSLVCKSKTEYTADGRGDGGFAHFPVFAGAYSFKSPES